MKKVLASLLLVFVFNFANGQGFSGQLIAGLNGSQIEGDQVRGYYKAGLVAGLSANFPLTDYWSIQPEILYSQKGSSEKINDHTYTIYDLKYIEFPLAFRYQMDNGLALEGGPAIAVYLSGTHYQQSGVESDPGFSDRFPDDLLGFIGMEFPITDGFTFNVRFTYSIPKLPTNAGFISRNNTLSFTLRLRIIKGAQNDE